MSHVQWLGVGSQSSLEFLLKGLLRNATASQAQREWRIMRWHQGHQTLPCHSALMCGSCPVGSNVVWRLWFERCFRVTGQFQHSAQPEAHDMLSIKGLHVTTTGLKNTFNYWVHLSSLSSHSSFYHHFILNDIVYDNIWIRTMTLSLIRLRIYVRSSCND